jgi:outer membrane protein
VQAGVDIHLQGNWFFNVDVKNLWLDTDVSVLNAGQRVTTEAYLDPWLCPSYA